MKWESSNQKMKEETGTLIFQVTFRVGFSSNAFEFPAVWKFSFTELYKPSLSLQVFYLPTQRVQ